MGDDARDPSLNVHSTPRTAELREFVAELAARVAAMEAERDQRRARISEILNGADQQPSFSQAKPKRDRHGMHIVRCAPVLLLGGAVHWLLRSQWHRRLATSALIAAMGAGAALSPDLMAPAPAAQVPAHHRVHRHHGTAPAAVPVPLPPRKRRRKPDAVAGSAPPRPSRSASPSPSATDPDPVPTVTPVPLPSVSPPLPVPTPAPTCTILHGHHCHGDGDVLRPLGEVTGQALRGLTGSL